MSDQDTFTEGEKDNIKGKDPDQVSLDSSDSESIGKAGEGKVEIIKEAYYTINDVMFEWAKVLDPWHVGLTL